MACAYTAHRAFSQIYSGIRRVSEGAERMMRGSFDFRLPEQSEGELAVLGHHFNRLSERLQQSLQKLDREKELLRNIINDISHQIRTPLSSLMMFMELLGGQPLHEDDQRKLLSKSNAQLERIHWLLHSLLRLSRLEADVVTLSVKPADLGETLHRAVGRSEARLTRKQLEVSVSVPESPVILPHDSDWLGEAIGNVIDNAADFSPDHGRISIALSASEVTASITISDCGTGIPEEELPHIFQRFYQGSQGRAGGRIGSGIGLALTKLIVEKHEGLISASSKSGQGSMFTITLPRTRLTKW
nr:HAMP domain-containing sensor histidine kinase [Paenibacillus turpanensis]